MDGSHGPEARFRLVMTTPRITDKVNQDFKYRYCTTQVQINAMARDLVDTKESEKAFDGNLVVAARRHLADKKPAVDKLER